MDKLENVLENGLYLPHGNRCFLLEKQGSRYYGILSDGLLLFLEYSYVLRQLHCQLLEAKGLVLVHKAVQVYRFRVLYINVAQLIFWHCGNSCYKLRDIHFLKFATDDLGGEQLLVEEPLVHDTNGNNFDLMISGF